MKKRILLFDDDESYGMILKRQGRRMNLEVVFCANIDDFCIKALEGEFDVVLIDYNLSESYKGDTVAQAIEGKPIFIISNDSRLSLHAGEWPTGIKGFIDKFETPETVLHKALGGVYKPGGDYAVPA